VNGQYRYPSLGLHIQLRAMAELAPARPELYLVVRALKKESLMVTLIGDPGLARRVQFAFFEKHKP
jgi:hypothetical protein